MTGEVIALWSCGVFFLIGLLTGVWKYLQIKQSDEARAHYYVDIAHRASLMYAFACLVLERFAALSIWPDWADAIAVTLSVMFFALAVGSYILHGYLKDTRNQLKQPHRLGASVSPPWLISSVMWALAVGEIGGFLFLFSGFVMA